MVDKQIRIDVTARDDASDKLDDVADAVDKIEKADPEVTVDADVDQADRKLDTVDELVDALDRRAAEVDVAADTSTAESGLADVEAAADEVNRLDPELVVGADVDAATRAVDDVKTEADALTDADRELILKAKISDAKGALKDLRGELETTKDKAGDVERAIDDVGTSQGPRLAGNAMSDLTGPFGEASGAAGDFGGVLDGLSDISESVGAAIGKDLSGVASGLGVVGFAVAGVAAGWTYFSQKAEEAKRKALEAADAQREINEAIAEGDLEAAADKLVESYGDVFDAADKAGIGIKQTTDYIRGAANDIPDLDKALADNAAALDESKAASQRYYDETGFLNTALVAQQENLLATRDALTGFRDKADAARGKNVELNGTINTQDRRLQAVKDALKKTTDGTDDLTAAQAEAEEQTKQLDEALGKLKDELSFERTLVRFNQDFREAFRKVRDGRKLTADDILSLKENVLDVAEFAKLTPAEVTALLRKIDRGKVREVQNEVQGYMDERTVQTPAGVKYVGGADQAQRDAQNAVNREGPVEIETKYRINWDSYYAATHPGNVNPGAQTAATASTFHDVTNVHMYLPRGYRENDVIGAARAAARRSGGLYRRSRR